MKLLNHLYIVITILLTVYGQIILKWRISNIGIFPENKLKFVALLLIDPIILSGFLAAFLASLTWMLAMTKFELSYAYPFMAFNFVLVILLSAGLLGEHVSVQKLLGIFLITVGTIVAAKG